MIVARVQGPRPTDGHSEREVEESVGRFVPKAVAKLPGAIWET